VGVDLAKESAPDATALLQLRRLLEREGLTKRLKVHRSRLVREDVLSVSQ